MILTVTLLNPGGWLLQLHHSAPHLKTDSPPCLISLCSRCWTMQTTRPAFPWQWISVELAQQEAPAGDCSSDPSGQGSAFQCRGRGSIPDGGNNMPRAVEQLGPPGTTREAHVLQQRPSTAKKKRRRRKRRSTSRRWEDGQGRGRGGGRGIRVAIPLCFCTMVLRMVLALCVYTTYWVAPCSSSNSHWTSRPSSSSTAHSVPALVTNSCCWKSLSPWSSLSGSFYQAHTSVNNPFRNVSECNHLNWILSSARNQTP